MKRFLNTETKKFKNFLNPNHNYYKVLKLPRNCSQSQIKSSFKYLAKKYHPDTSISPNTILFNDITEAYSVLSSKKLRNSYDNIQNPKTWNKKNTNSLYEEFPNVKFNFSSPYKTGYKETSLSELHKVETGRTYFEQLRSEYYQAALKAKVGPNIPTFTSLDIKTENHLPWAFEMDNELAFGKVKLFSGIQEIGFVKKSTQFSERLEQDVNVFLEIEEFLKKEKHELYESLDLFLFNNFSGHAFFSFSENNAKLIFFLRDIFSMEKKLHYSGQLVLDNVSSKQDFLPKSLFIKKFNFFSVNEELSHYLIMNRTFGVLHQDWRSVKNKTLEVRMKQAKKCKYYFEIARPKFDPRVHKNENLLKFVEKNVDQLLGKDKKLKEGLQKYTCGELMHQLRVQWAIENTLMKKNKLDGRLDPRIPIFFNALTHLIKF
eukprot:maker-scaffold_23-snap-gene-5.3-mRNA-1 protein AED:0.00 eAED:0.00 QI:12/1/1/1/1/1/2/68/430